MKDSKVDEYYYRLGMTIEMRKEVEDWRVLNRDESTGKTPSFAEALRMLISLGINNDSQ